MYQKEIIYIGLYKDGSRIGNAGFLKVENRERESRLDLKLRNIPFNIKGRFPVRIHNGSDWNEINGISVQEGGGSWEETMEDRAQKVQVQIMLPGGYFLEGRSRNAPIVPMQRTASTAGDNTPDLQKEETDREPVKSRQRSYSAVEPSGLQEEAQGSGRRDKAENREPETRNAAQEDGVGATRNAVQEDSVKERRNAVREEGVKETQNNTREETEIISLHNAREKRAESGFRKDAKTVIITEELKPSSVRETASGNFGPEPPAAYSLKEDKWEQILDSYEKIHPYGDERVYVKLEPKDFIILRSNYQHLVNNSFLLHGFYNYRYVILGKENDYYLGVPGVFYEREKMVALMFGFEAFECPGGVAKAGEFGYYLRKVEL